MKKFLFIFVAIFSQTVLGDIVVKVVSGKEILTGSTEGKALELKFSQKRSKIEAEGQKLEAELKSDYTKMQTKARTVDQASLARYQDDLMSKEKSFKSKMEGMQEQFGRDVNRELAKLNQKINDLVVKIAKSKNWDLVILKETGEVIYASEKVDATKTFIEIIDKEFKPEVKPEFKPEAAPAA